MSRKPREGALSDILKSVGRHMRDIRRAAGLTQGDVAKSIGISIQAVRNWELGKHEPSGAHLQRLAQLYKLSVNELLDITSALTQSSETTLSRMIPIKGYLLAGEHHVNESPIGELPIPGFIADDRPNVFGLVINGESLKWNGIQDGDIVLVDPDLPLDNGGVYVLRDQGKLFASIVELDGDLVRLKDSDGWSHEILLDQVGVVGKIIWHLSLRQV